MPSSNFDFDVITRPSATRRHPDKPPAPEPPASLMKHSSDLRSRERDMHNELSGQISNPAFSSTFLVWVRLLQALDYMPVQPTVIDTNPSHDDVIDVAHHFAEASTTARV